MTETTVEMTAVPIPDTGHLAYAGTEISDDVRGGNAGKIHRTYAWVPRG